MKTILNAALAIALATCAAATPALAKKHSQTRYEYNGRYYNSYQACRAQRSKAGKDGAIVGAATAGIGAALLGGNLGQSALVAGGGALVGNQIGRSKRC